MTPQPEWVQQEIRDLQRVQDKLVECATLLGTVVRVFQLAAGGSHNESLVVNDIVSAAHDLQHVMDHAISTRRGLLMSWPDDDLDKALS